MSEAHESPRRLLITNGSVLRGTEVHDVPEQLDVLVVDGVITQIGRDLLAGLGDEPVEILDATDRLLIPGMINAHYHSHDTLAKGTLEEEPLEYWRLLALPPQYPKRSREEVKVRTLLGAYECLRSGMTTVQDMVTLFPFDPEHLEAVVEAYEEIGLRAVVGLQYADKKGISTIPHWEDVFPKELHGDLSTAAEPDVKIDQLAYLEANYLQQPPRDRISWALGPSAPERCTKELVQRTVALAEQYDLQIFTHIYESKGMALQARHEYPEYGGSLIRRLQDEGMLGPRLNLAHSVWLLDDEIEILAETGTNVVLNPLSNLKLKSGIPPIHALEAAGVSFGLGCDNCSCSDAQNMFQAMKLFALLAAVSSPDPGPNQADQAFRAATRGGAHALNRDDDLGRIEPGYRGDLVTLDLTDPTFVPLNSAVRQLVYTESGRGVTDVIVDGRVVIRGGVLQTMDPAELMARVAAVLPEFMKDFEEVKQRTDGLRGYLLEAHHRIWAEDVGANRLFTGK
jgi:5-methylthioadenosine/S-adenosylhomocysteine deaminase